MGKINYRTDDINNKLKQIDELVGSNKNLSNQINNFNSQLDTITTLCLSDGDGLEKVLNPLIALSNGTRILIPSGDYILNDTIQILRDNIHLDFAKGCKITTSFHNKNAIWIGHNVKNITIENINIVGIANADNEDWCVSVGENSNNIKFMHNRFENFTGGIMLVRNNSNILFDGNTFLNMVFPTNLNPTGEAGKTTGGYGIVYQSSHDVITVNNYFKNIDRHCLYVGRDPANGDLIGYNHTISNNLFLMESKEKYITTYEYAVKVMGNKNVTFNNNVFDGGVGHLWLIASGTSDIQCQNITVVGNTFRNITKGNSNSSCAIGSASNVGMTSILENCSITGNTIMDCDCLSAIKFDVIINTIIANNTIKNITRHGVLVEYGVKDSMINNNIIYNVERGIMLKGSLEFGDTCDTKLNQIKECEFGVWYENIRYGNIANNNIRTNKYNSIILNKGCFEGTIHGNKFDGGNTAIAIKNENTKNFYCYDNMFGSHSVQKIENLNGIYLLKPFLSIGNREQKMFISNNPPSTGTWTEGDRCYLEVPGSGGVEGYICTVGGSPGTWKAFGTILS